MPRKQRISAKSYRINFGRKIQNRLSLIFLQKLKQQVMEFSKTIIMKKIVKALCLVMALVMLGTALTGCTVRREVAMTGEITIRGRVLEIGGLKEKSLAAHRAGINTIIFPYENIKDLDEIPENIKSQIEFIPVKTMDDVLKIAIKKPNEKFG
mgnify:CR=1 FL=1